MTLAVFALTGCSFFENQAPKKQAPRTQQKPVKSAIKGFIKELHYEDSKYCYTIIASDTKNAKLPSANFCSTRYYYDKGDLVYATFIGKQLESMLLIREGSSRGSFSGIKKPQNDIVIKKEKYQNEYRNSKRRENNVLIIR